MTQDGELKLVNPHLTHPSSTVLPPSSRDSTDNCKSLASEQVGEFSELPDAERRCAISPTDQRFGRAEGVTEISGKDERCMLCRCSPGRPGVEVFLCGVKLCDRPVSTFKDKFCFLVLLSSLRNSKLLADFACFCGGTLRASEGVTGNDDVDNERLLSLVVAIPVKINTF